MMLHPTLRTAGVFLAFAGCCAVTGWTTPRLERNHRVALDSQEPIYLPKAEYLRLMSLGYNNVLADILWFRTISYFGQHFRGDRTYPWLAHMCDLVTDLDPRAQHVYRFAGMILPWEAGQADAGIRLLEKGIVAFPDSWLLHYWLGFSYYFFKDDFDAATRYLKVAAQLPDAHPAAADLAARLASKRYGPQTTMQFLAEIRNNAYSDEMRDAIAENIRDAKLAFHLEQLNSAISAYHARYGSPPPNLQTLVEVGAITRVPLDPYGGVYEIDPQTGKARSSTGRRPSILYQSKLREKHLQASFRGS